MKENFYLIIRDGHNDEEPDFSGPFSSIAKAKLDAKNYSDEDVCPGRIFTIIGINEKTEVTDYASATTPSVTDLVWEE
jgi:hypothetical protein